MKIPDGEIIFHADFIPEGESIQWFTQLCKEVAWRQDFITLYGNTHLVPRLQALYGDPGISYKYSGMLLPALSWTPLLERIRQRVEAAASHKFNAVLCNLYRNGKDSNGWHADDEPELGKDPLIASLSLGVTRRFLLKHNKEPERRLEYALSSGSLLIMKGSLQTHWKHQIPKELKVSTSRINLTFRLIQEEFLKSHHAG